MKYLTTIFFLLFTVRVYAQDFQDSTEVLESAVDRLPIDVLTEQGDIESQFLLGSAYLSGIGMPKHDARAEKWLTHAAEADHAEAQNLVGVHFSDDSLKVDWYKKAAQRGLPVAQFNLAYSYEGEGIHKDQEEAYIWYSIAAANGYDKADERRDQVLNRILEGQYERWREAKSNKNSYFWIGRDFRQWADSTGTVDRDAEMKMLQDRAVKRFREIPSYSEQ